MSTVYKALLARQENETFSVDYEELSPEQIGDGDVEIAVEYSTLNYKDGLAITNTIPIVQSSPLILGIDMAGTVVSSGSDRFQAGDRVVLNGYGASESHNGGYTQRLRTRSEFLVPLPDNISTRQAMAIGTAGYTAMLSVMRLEQTGIGPESGPVLVTGASGGVGTVAIVLLSRLGYQVTASTGRPEQADFLHQLGAVEVIHRSELSDQGEMMQTPRWMAAVDSCGSHTLANVIAKLHYGGVVTACGLAQGLDLPANMMPFALRNVSLLGVDSVHAPMALREEAWRRLGNDLDIEKLEALAFELPFAEVKAAAPGILQGQVRGRAVVPLVDA